MKTTIKRKVLALALASVTAASVGSVALQANAAAWAPANSPYVYMEKLMKMGIKKGVSKLADKIPVLGGFAESTINSILVNIGILDEASAGISMSDLMDGINSIKDDLKSMRNDLNKQIDELKQAIAKDNKKILEHITDQSFVGNLGSLLNDLHSSSKNAAAQIDTFLADSSLSAQDKEVEIAALIERSSDWIKPSSYMNEFSVVGEILSGKSFVNLDQRSLYQIVYDYYRDDGILSGEAYYKALIYIDNVLEEYMYNYTVIMHCLDAARKVSKFTDADIKKLTGTRVDLYKSIASATSQIESMAKNINNHLFDITDENSIIAHYSQFRNDAENSAMLYINKGNAEGTTYLKLQPHNDYDTRTGLYPSTTEKDPYTLNEVYLYNLLSLQFINYPNYKEVCMPDGSTTRSFIKYVFENYPGMTVKNFFTKVAGADEKLFGTTEQNKAYIAIEAKPYDYDSNDLTLMGDDFDYDAYKDYNHILGFGIGFNGYEPDAISENDLSDVEISRAYNIAKKGTYGWDQGNILNCLLINTNPMLLIEEDEAFKNISSVSNANPTVGEVVTVDCITANSVGDETFVIKYKQGDGEWQTIIRDNTVTPAKVSSSAPAASLVFDEAGTYTIRVEATNVKGQTNAKELTVNVSDPLKNKSAVSASKVALGTPVTVNCAAEGGSDDILYTVFYKKASSSKWTTVQSSSKNATVTIKPAVATDYQVRVKAIDNASPADNRVSAIKTFTVKVYNAMENTSTISDETINKGDSVTVNCSSKGGVGTTLYTVSVKKASSNKWSVAKSNTTKSKVVVTPAAAGQYNIRVEAVDKGVAVADRVPSVKEFTVNVAAPLKNTSSLSKNVIVKGGTITVNCASTGGAGKKVYSVFVKKANSDKWSLVQASSENTAVEITPASVAAYVIRVKATDEKGVVDSKELALTVNGPLTNNSVISSDTIKLGKTVQVNAIAVGGVGEYAYHIAYKKQISNTWSRIDNLVADAAVEIKPVAATTYDIRVEITDADETSVVKYFTVTVKK